jgi:hypothetical protein
MANVRKFGLALGEIILISCLLLSLNAHAKPSVAPPPFPSFTVSLVDSSYDAPAITDPYNGNITTPAHHVTNYQLELKIKNVNVPYTEVYYNIQTKGFYESTWTGHSRDRASDSEYTTVRLSADYRAGDKIDIQVQTEIVYQYEQAPILPNHDSTFLTGYQKGSWSPAQTFTMPDTSTPLATQTPRIESAAPTIIPQTISIIILTISVLVAAVIIKKKTNSKPNREHD